MSGKTGFSVKLYENSFEKILVDGRSLRREHGEACRWHRAYRKADIERQTASNSRQEGVRCRLFFLWMLRKNFPPWEDDEESSRNLGGSGAQNPEVGTSERSSRNRRDLGIKWPQWHTLTFEEQVKVEMRVARKMSRKCSYFAV